MCLSKLCNLKIKVKVSFKNMFKCLILDDSYFRKGYFCDKYFNCNFILKIIGICRCYLNDGCCVNVLFNIWFVIFLRSFMVGFVRGNFDDSFFLIIGFLM